MTIVERGRVSTSSTASSGVLSMRRAALPPHLPHGATMLEEEVVLVDVFTPPREDFLAR